MAQVLIVSNRLPLSVTKVDGELVFSESLGGLATGLASYVKDRHNTWVGWPGIVSEELTEQDKLDIILALARHNCSPVFLSQKQVDDYYGGYSNTLLWPLFHSMRKGKDSSHERCWRSYREVNKAFAQAVAEIAEPDASIWVHDYQLLLVPSMIKEALPRNHVGYFHHIPFPLPATFLRLPEAKRLVQGMLGADLIGFHTKQYVDNFLATVKRFGIGETNEGQLFLSDHTVRVTDFPMGIDYQKFKLARSQPEVKKAVRTFRQKYKGKKIIAGIDRLDITKGFIERLEAYRMFLERNPKLLGNVVFVLVGAPSRSELEAYQALSKKVQTTVKSINRQFGTPLWQPVDYNDQGLPFEEVTALFQITDVAFVTPRRDGMNLVAKEYIASRPRNGVLILSETAGAAQELHRALLVNLRDPMSLVHALEKSLSMGKLDISRRFNTMQHVVADHTVHGWAKEFMGTLQKPLPLPVRPLSAATERKLAAEYALASKRALFLDYDGTMTELAAKPEDAKPTNALLATLNTLVADPRNTVYVISGRSRNDMAEWLSHTGVGMVAEHGAFIRKPGHKSWQPTSLANTSWKKTIRPILALYAADTPEAHVEEKATTLVWHYRGSPPYQTRKNLVLLKKELKPLLKQFGLRAHSGKKILEIKHKDTDKGVYMTELLFGAAYDFILTAGDDYTDEQMFKAVPHWAYSIKVGGGGTDARFRVKHVARFVALLAKLAG